MPMISGSSLKPLSVLALAIFAIAGAQGPAVAGSDTVFFASKVGSFKILGGGPSNPPVGDLEMSFSGTLLISGAENPIQVTGNLKKEYDAHKKVAYHGTGKITVKGKFFSAQWFGRDMTGSFKGVAIIRLYGEFDKDLNTGSYWYGSEPNNKQNWNTGGMQVLVPQPVGQRKVVPKVRSSGG